MDVGFSQPRCKWISDWVKQLDKNKKCPFAKPAFDKNKMKAVMLNSIDAYHFWHNVSQEAEKFDDTYDVVIVAMETDETIIISLRSSRDFVAECLSLSI